MDCRLGPAATGALADTAWAGQTFMEFLAPDLGTRRRDGRGSFTKKTSGKRPGFSPFAFPYSPLRDPAIHLTPAVKIVTTLAGASG